MSENRAGCSKLGHTTLELIYHTGPKLSNEGTRDCEPFTFFSPDPQTLAHLAFCASIATWSKRALSLRYIDLGLLRKKPTTKTNTFERAFLCIFQGVQVFRNLAHNKSSDD